MEDFISDFPDGNKQQVEMADKWRVKLAGWWKKYAIMIADIEEVLND